MNDGWDKMRQAKEEQFFEQQNKEALARLKAREQNTVRACPVNGKALEQITAMGVIIDRCPDCGGVWLDSGELEEVIKRSKDESSSAWIGNFFGTLFSKKS